MSKLRLVVLALAAGIAVGSVAVAGAKPHHQQNHHKPKKIKVPTKVNFTYTAGHSPTSFDPYHPYDPYDPTSANAQFNGQVKAKKGCASRRIITVSSLGHTCSARDGTFSYAVNGTAAANGDYRVHVKGKTMERGHGKHKRKIRCKPVSKTLTLVAGS
jgi:hypothetical protein